jgi:hypothetical protein
MNCDFGFGEDFADTAIYIAINTAHRDSECKSHGPYILPAHQIHVSELAALS